MTYVLLLTTTGASWFMTGLIWFVQVVHYPLMGVVGSETWNAYHRRHTALTTRIVLPVMLVELGTMILLLVDATSRGQIILWIAGALLAVAWLSTFFVQVPAHNQLSAGFSDEWHTRLVRSNWMRTFAWTARSILLTLAFSQNITVG